MQTADPRYALDSAQRRAAHYASGMSTLIWNVRSTSLDMMTQVAIALPDQNPPEHLLYLLHGLTGNHLTWLLDGGAHRIANDRNIAIVMPDAQRSFYLDQPYALGWETWIADELPGLIARTFQLPTSRLQTAIAGMSMGGYGALRLALHQPQRFGVAISLSGTVDIAEDAFQQRHPDLFETFIGTYDVRGTSHDLLAELPGAPRDLKLWLTCGESDRLLGQHYSFVEAAAACDFPLTHSTGPGAHNWKFWAPRFEQALDWWLEG